jgi:hypothetical protein
MRATQPVLYSPATRIKSKHSSVRARSGRIVLLSLGVGEWQTRGREKMHGLEKAHKKRCVIVCQTQGSRPAVLAGP